MALTVNSHGRSSPSRRRTLAAAVALALLAAGCGRSIPVTSTSTRASGTLDGRPARLDIPGTASLLVPAAAVSAPTSVAMAVATPPAPPPSPAQGNVVAFTPHGTVFAAPVMINLAFPAASLGSGGRAPLRVVRLADENATEWTDVGGATFAFDAASGAAVATFQTTTFSYYAVIEGECVVDAPAVPAACTSACECCGGASCVDLGDPRNCGACGNACGAAAFCSAAAACVPVATASLCENPAVRIVQGELPPLSVVSPEQTRDGVFAQQVVDALAAHCAGRGQPITVSQVSQADPAVLDACTSAPLLGAGNTLVLIGGSWGQRLAGFLDKASAPVVLTYDAAADAYTFSSRAGATIVTFANARLGPGHDYFVVSVEPEAGRGALVLQVYGVGWEGTPAAAWYFTNVVLPGVEAGTRPFGSYQVVEWSEANANGVKDAGDTWQVLATDIP